MYIVRCGGVRGKATIDVASRIAALQLKDNKRMPTDPFFEETERRQMRSRIFDLVLDIVAHKRSPNRCALSTASPGGSDDLPNLQRCSWTLHRLQPTKFTVSISCSTRTCGQYVPLVPEHIY